MRDGFITVAAGTPRIRVADCRYNAEQIFTMIREADSQGVKILALPELCLTGYTCGDLFLQDTLLDGAAEGLRTILEATGHLEILTALGMPVRAGGKLYNCAVVIQRGRVLAVVPKTYLPNYGEFYEKRWFASGGEAPDAVPRDPVLALESYGGMGQSVIDCPDVPGLKIGVEICEDLWAADPPSRRLAEAGATLILNLSASNEVVGKAAYRRQLVVGQSGRLCCGYVYADAGEGESTTDVVFTGHNMIAENGALLAENRLSTGLTISEIDVQRLVYERRRLTTFPAEDMSGLYRSEAEFTPAAAKLRRYVSPTPFIPENAADRAAPVSGDPDHLRSGPEKAAGAHRGQDRRGGPLRGAGQHPGSAHHRPGHGDAPPARRGHHRHHHALLRHHGPDEKQRRPSGGAHGGDPADHPHRRDGEKPLPGHRPRSGGPLCHL